MLAASHAVIAVAGALTAAPTPDVPLAGNGNAYVGTAFSRKLESTLVVDSASRRTLRPSLAFQATC